MEKIIKHFEKYINELNEKIEGIIRLDDDPNGHITMSGWGIIGDKRNEAAAYKEELERLKKLSACGCKKHTKFLIFKTYDIETRYENIKTPLCKCNICNGYFSGKERE